ncbi:MAG: nucleotidyltransferase domain-containing protein [Candidatus Subteraquimicrobiales bacterium]|nr:nucleotidyltransferase domain-containing protein [Candidatus Subteraquimicrobiales bacterium]
MDLVELKSKIMPLAEKYNLKLVVLFGSRVSGRVHKESDFDVAYLSWKELSLSEESGFMFGLMPILKIRDERLVNIVDIKTAGPLMLYSITQKGILLFEHETSSFLKLKLYAWKNFIDSQLFRNNYFRIVKERVAQI